MEKKLCVIFVLILFGFNNFSAQNVQDQRRIGRFSYVVSPHLKNIKFLDEKNFRECPPNIKMGFMISFDTCTNFEGFYREKSDTGLMWPALDKVVGKTKILNWKCPLNNVKCRFTLEEDPSEGGSYIFVSFFDEVGERERFNFYFNCINVDLFTSIPANAKKFVMSQLSCLVLINPK